MVRMAVQRVMALVLCCAVGVVGERLPVLAQDAESTPATPTAGERPAAATEGSEAPASKAVKLPEVVVQGVQQRDLPDQEAVKEIPGVVNVVTREELQRARPKNADEMLRRIPGVTIMEEYGQGLRPNIGIRGLNPTRSRNVLVLVDEIPVQPALFGDPAMYYMVPIERVDHIEVIKGGASVLYSPNTQGGLINFVTKNIPSTPTFSTTNTFGSFNMFQSSTTYGGRFGNLGAQMGYVRRQSDGFREHGASQLDDFTFRLEMNPDIRTRVVANVDWYNETSQTPGGITPAQFAADRTRAGKLLDEFKGQRGSIDVTATHEFTTRASSLSTATSSSGIGTFKIRTAPPAPSCRRARTSCASSTYSASFLSTRLPTVCSARNTS